MRVKITPSTSLLSGRLRIPSSKSHTLRAILFATFSEGTSVIHNFLEAEDTQAMIDACENLGAKISQRDRTLFVQGIGSSPLIVKGEILAGHSGIVLRFIGAMAALGSESIVITGDKNRSVKPLLEALKQLGAVVKSQEGFAPFSVKGPLTQKKASLSGEDSQMVSALLMAASFSEGNFEIHVDHPGEKPWIDLSLSWLLRMGKKVSHEEYRVYHVQGEKKPCAAFEYTVPSDFSSLAFPLLAGIIQGEEIHFENIDFADCQGDKKVIDVLESMGAALERGKDFLKTGSVSSLKGCHRDINDFIDGLPILAVAGCLAKGTTTLSNARVARKKESDRIRSMVLELGKMGAMIKEQEEGLIIQGSSLKGATLYGHGDHRVAMALAIAALKAEGATIIEGFECIAKTYPGFMRDLQSIGVDIHEI